MGNCLSTNKTGVNDLGLFKFEKKTIERWDHNDVSTMFTRVGLKELIQYDSLVPEEMDGNFLIDVKCSTILKKMKKIEEINERTKKLFVIYLKYVKFCHTSKRMFSLGFRNVLDKLMLGGTDLEDEDVKPDDVLNHCTVLSNWDLISKYLLSGLNPEKAERIKIKLIITENSFSSQERFLKQMIAPIINFLPQFHQDFGVFHTAILISSTNSGIYLQWGTSELILPKSTIKSGSAILGIDTMPVEIETTQEFEEIKTIIAKHIAKWNTQYTYSKFKSDKNTGNCQDYINDLFKELNIQLEISGCFKEFLDKIKRKGSYKIQFTPSKEFVESFKLKNNKDFESWKKKKDGLPAITFPNHKALDDFLFFCYKSNTPKCAQALSGEKFESEYRLLKSFDRAFWLRHIKEPMNIIYKPAPVAEGRNFGSGDGGIRSGCIFYDPRGTNSYF